MTLTIEDFLQFLNGVRGSRYYCSYCGHDAFAVFTDNDPENPVVARMPLALATDAAKPELYGVCCTKCGNTAFFSGDVVREALAKNRGVKAGAV